MRLRIGHYGTYRDLPSTAYYRDFTHGGVWQKVGDCIARAVSGPDRAMRPDWHRANLYDADPAAMVRRVKAR